jgi:hypothetical protein
MSQSVQRLSDVRLAELRRLFADLERLFADLERLCPDLADSIDTPAIVEALRTEDYRYLHDACVFSQHDAFPPESPPDDGLDEVRFGFPILLKGISPITWTGWLEDLPAVNAPVFVAP